MFSSFTYLANVQLFCDCLQCDKSLQCLTAVVNAKGVRIGRANVHPGLSTSTKLAIFLKTSCKNTELLLNKICENQNSHLEIRNLSQPHWKLNVTVFKEMLQICIKNLNSHAVASPLQRHKRMSILKISVISQVLKLSHFNFTQFIRTFHKCASFAYDASIYDNLLSIRYFIDVVQVLYFHYPTRYTHVISTLIDNRLVLLSQK